ncbi:MAG: response regulator [Pseudomonadota bacterium]
MGKKILIVDDDETMLRLLANELKKEGYSVITATNGANAINYAICEKPDIIIMDILLPDMQGSDAVKRMQNSADAPDDLNIIFLSGVVIQDDEYNQRVQVGGKYYPAIPKPLDLDRLLKMLL